VGRSIVSWIGLAVVRFTPFGTRMRGEYVTLTEPIDLTWSCIDIVDCTFEHPAEMVDPVRISSRTTWGRFEDIRLLPVEGDG